MKKTKFKLVSSKTRYLLPNILTLAGVCLGISSIKFSIDEIIVSSNINFNCQFGCFRWKNCKINKRNIRIRKRTRPRFCKFGIAPAFICILELNNYGKLGWAITQYTQFVVF